MKLTRGPKRDRRHDRRGFSLLELVVVVMVIGVLASIAVPRYGNFVARQRIEAAAQRITTDLGLAQRQARVSSKRHKVVFTVATHCYGIFVWNQAGGTWDGIDSLTHSSQTYVVDLSDEPYDAALVSADFGGDSEIIFDGYGTPDSGGTVVVRVGSYTQTITIDPGAFSINPLPRKFEAQEVQ